MYDTDLFIFKPGQTFWCKDKPIISAATFHNAQIVDCHVTFSDDLYLKKISLKKKLARVLIDQRCKWSFLESIKLGFRSYEPANHSRTY